MILSYEEILTLNPLEKKILSEASHISKCLYNYTLYNQRQFFRETEGKYLNKFKIYSQVRDQNPKLYYKLNSWVSQAIIYRVDRDYQSFFKHLKVASPGEKIRPPQYKKNGLFEVEFGGPSLFVENGRVRVSLSKYLRNRYGVKFLHFQIPSYLKDQNIDLVILKPQSHGQFKIKFCYEVEEKPKVESSKVLGIDLGTNNLAACVSSEGDAFLFSGKKLKSQNQFYNKKSADFQSQIDLEKHALKKMKIKQQKISLTKKRARRIKDTLHKVSSNIISYCINNDISKIVIGKNIGWKNEVNLGRINNQNFVQIPHAKLIFLLQYKAEKHGLTVETIEESYTSKTDSLALEPISRQEKYLGKRVKRGLFQSSLGKLVNADINGAINILRKSIGDAFVKELTCRGCVFQPWYFAGFKT